MQIELDKIPEYIRNGKLSKQNASMEIFTILYTNPARFNLHTMDEDERSDFLVSMIPKFESYIDRYDQNQCPFGAYIFNIVSWIKTTWTKKQGLNKTNPLTFQKTILDHYPVFTDEDTSLKYIHSLSPQLSENLLQLHEEKTPQLIFRQIFDSGEKGKYVFKKPELTQSRRIALLLALKSAWYISDEQIEKISIFCGCPPQAISTTVEKLKENLENKAKSHERLCEMRDKAWYFICIYRNMLEKMEKDTEEYLDLKRKLNYQEHVWVVKNNMLKNCKSRISPTNTDVAEAVGIKPSRVSFYMGMAKKSNLDLNRFL